MKKDKSFFEKFNIKWVISISIVTFILAAIFSVVSEKLVSNLNIGPAFIVLVIIIVIGIIFDIIGTAVTSAEERPFHAMAANRVQEARHAIKLVRNASQVSNFSNDVIGDISGIISGAVGTNIVYSIVKSGIGLNEAVLSIVITSFIAALTVGGKALGKAIAMTYYEEIIHLLAKVLYFLDRNLGIELFKDKKIKK